MAWRRAGAAQTPGSLLMKLGWYHLPLRIEQGLAASAEGCRAQPPGQQSRTEPPSKPQKGSAPRQAPHLLPVLRTLAHLIHQPVQRALRAPGLSYSKLMADLRPAPAGTPCIAQPPSPCPASPSLLPPPPKHRGLVRTQPQGATAAACSKGASASKNAAVLARQLQQHCHKAVQWAQPAPGWLAAAILLASSTAPAAAAVCPAETDSMNLLHCPWRCQP